MAAVTYVLPVGHGRDALGFYSVFSRSKFATLSGSPGLGLLGNSNIYGARYAMPLPVQDNFTHTLTLGIDYKDVKQTVVVAGSSELPTPITYTPLVAVYNGNWQGNGRTTTLDVTTMLGMRGFLGNNEDEFAAKRHGASASFFSLRSSLQHVENIGRWSLGAKLEIQLASGPLVSNEQFAAGGAESVRGYLEGERVGDSAQRWAVEVRTPKMSPAGAGSPIRLVGLAFYEGARLQTMQAIYPQPSHQLLRGTGIGLRVEGGHGLTFDLDLARALDNADQTRSGDFRVHSRLLWNF
jgi:hemolysin activation/secretion protein